MYSRIVNKWGWQDVCLTIDVVLADKPSEDGEDGRKLPTERLMILG